MKQKKDPIRDINKSIQYLDINLMKTFQSHLPKNLKLDQRVQKWLHCMKRNTMYVNRKSHYLKTTNPD